MANRTGELDDQLIDFIRDQPVFFVGTAAPEGKVNVSPKGLDSLRVLGPRRILWLNLTGSGNETAAHLLESDRLTLMFCAFAGNPLILRVFGTARAVHETNRDWNELAAHFPDYIGARQIFDVAVEMVQTSCGTGVPLLAYEGERDQLLRSAARKGRDGVRRYWAEKNRRSIDGKPTGIPGAT